MANLTTYNYFTGDIAIPNYAGSNNVNVAIQNAVSQYIFDYEPEFLKILLGKETYDAMIAGLAVLPTPAAKWTQLRDEIWKVTVISANPALSRYDSPCARYIFFKYYADSLTFSSTTGERQGTAENSELAPSTRRLVQCWNRMSDRAEEIWEWIEDDVRNVDYPDFYRPVPNLLSKINVFGI